ncbi:MAG: hypothetical protein JSU72_15785 [Deltaproteobacteria bacterium]|nr:MAG: hypothetical protein JSU72_15785 [Deltaproteobacteria bacterium]
MPERVPEAGGGVETPRKIARKRPKKWNKGHMYAVLFEDHEHQTGVTTEDSSRPNLNIAFGRYAMIKGRYIYFETWTPYWPQERDSGNIERWKLLRTQIVNASDHGLVDVKALLPDHFKKWLDEPED